MQNKNIHTTVRVNFPNSRDTFFTSGGVKGLPSFPAKRYSSHGNSGKKLKDDFMSGAITVTVTTTSTSCGYSTGSIIVAASGGNAPYTYSCGLYGYPVYQNTGNFQNLEAGVYEVIVTDADSMADTTIVTVVNNNPPPSCIISGYQYPSTCSSFDGALTVTASNGTPPYQYSLDDITYQASNVITGLTQGLYSVFVKDANGCTTQTELSFLGGNGSCLGLGFGYSAYTCNNNGYIKLAYIVSGTPPYLFSLDGINYQSDSSFNNLATGVHHIYIKDAAGIINIYTVVSTPYCPVIINDSTADASCGQGDGYLSISPAFGVPPYTYTLDGINYQASNFFTALYPGNYTYTVKDATGSSYSGYVTIGSNCPVITAISTDATCGLNDGTIHAAGNKGALPYLFSINGTLFQSNNIFNNLTAGTYTVTIKDANGFKDSTSVTVGSSCLQINVNIINAVCSKPNGSITASGGNGVPPYQYSINGADFQTGGLFNSLDTGMYTLYVKDAAGAVRDTTITITGTPGPTENVTLTQASCNNTNGSLQITASGGASPYQYSINGIDYQAPAIFTNLDSGKYTPSVKDANGCMVSDTVLLTALPTPVVFIGNDTALCIGDKLTLTAQSNGLTYLWQDNSTGSSYTVMASGDYYVKVTNQFSCSASDTIIVRYKVIPPFTLGPDTSLCPNQVLILQPAPRPAGAYLWNTGAVSGSIDINTSGEYTLQVTDSGCSKADTVEVLYKPAPMVYLGKDTTLCSGKTLVLDAFYPGSTYLWQDGSQSPEFSVMSAGNYGVEVSLNGCIAGDTIQVSYIDKPQFTLGRDTVICQGESILLQPRINVPATFFWQDGSTQSYYNIKDTGVYVLTAGNICGSNTDEIKITAGLCSLLLPNAFTPNGDGINDVFGVKYPFTVKTFLFTIYNRFGEKVFETTEMSKGWDGSYRGIIQPMGSYVWVINLKDVNNKEQNSKGVITLIR